MVLITAFRTSAFVVTGFNDFSSPPHHTSCVNLATQMSITMYTDGEVTLKIQLSCLNKLKGKKYNPIFSL